MLFFHGVSFFSHNHGSEENPPKWKGPTTIGDIPFSTEPWLWEEGHSIMVKDLTPINNPYKMVYKWSSTQYPPEV